MNAHHIQLVMHVNGRNHQVNKFWMKILKSFNFELLSNNVKLYVKLNRYLIVKALSIGRVMDCAIYQ